MEYCLPNPIVRNHIVFLATHRGHIIESGDGFALEGQAPFLSFFAPSHGAAEIRPECTAIWLYPWSGEGWPDRLSAAGFAVAERMSYMQLGSLARRSAGESITIERVETRPVADEFASVQRQGFLVDKSEQNAWWTDCFKRMARRNYLHADQDFLLARVGGEPAAVLLTVRAGDTTGIYAVATVPEQRGKGLSTALLDRAIVEGTGQVVLQVMAESYPHDFYRRRGFEDQFACQVWRR